jgi:hypothetical protein
MTERARGRASFLESGDLKMMLLNIITLSLLASVLLGAQITKSKKTTPTTQSTPIMHTTDERIEGSDVNASTGVNRSVQIRYGQEVLVPGYNFKIKFVAVPEDSRCPTGVNCIWAGNVRVLLHVAKAKSKPVKVELDLNPRDSPHGQTANYGNYKLKLLGVDPYPVDGQQRAAKDYTVTLDVSKK